MARFVHLGLLDVNWLLPNKKAPLGAFLLGDLEFKRGCFNWMPEAFQWLESSSARWNTGGLDPTHLPRNKNTNEEDNRKPNPKGEGRGHVAFFGGLTLNGWRVAPHHVNQSRAQAQHNAYEGDDNQYFHDLIII